MRRTRRAGAGKSQWEVLGEFIGNLVVGGVMFLAVLVVGGALSSIVHWLPGIVPDGHFLDLMAALERFILDTDIAFIC